MNTRHALIRQRTVAGMSRKELADHLGITESYYGMIEQGVRQPSLRVAASIAKLLGVTVDDVFVDDNTTICCVAPAEPADRKRAAHPTPGELLP